MTESEIQSDIMIALGDHPKVAWCFVTSTGTFRGLKGGRPIKIGIKGLPDIIGQLRGGELFGLEIKRSKEKPTEDQLYFLDMIAKNNGVSGYATNVKEAIQIIEG